MTRLTPAAAFAPVAVTLHCEQILSDLSALDPPRFIKLISQYVALPAANLSNNDGNLEFDMAVKSTASTSTLSSPLYGYPSISPHVRLLAMHVLASAVKHSSSSYLLAELPTLIPRILPSFSSALVDLRKAVVFVLVEVYMIVGDVLHSYVSSLLPPQKKLLTIYIERQMAQR